MMALFFSSFCFYSSPSSLLTPSFQIPLRRAGVPEDIAGMAVFLASEEASYCTGSTYFVDGGWMLTQPQNV